jgi:ethanolamine utilization protein EutQ (cupin superfamily)
MLMEKKNIDSEFDEQRPFQAHGYVNVVTLADQFTLGKGVFQPGWRWSNDVKPIAGTESCEVGHTGIVLEGSITVRGNDGTEVTYDAGDVMLCEPGHDAWVNGDEACVVLDTGYKDYAKPQS